MNKNLIQFLLGITLALVGVAIMFEGQIFDERTIGIAIITGILGITLIATSKMWKTKES